MIKFTIDTIDYYGGKDNGSIVFRNDKTLGYIFMNAGNCNILLNNMILLPGTTFKTFEVGYVDQTRWRMNFQVTAGTCGAINAQLTTLIYNAI
jgi:hypothetical protein